MNLSVEDQILLEELCEQHGVSKAKVIKLLYIVREYEFKVPLRIPIISAGESNPKRRPGGETMLDTLS